MAAPTSEKKPSAAQSSSVPDHQPYVADNVEMHEFTFGAVIAGVILGIVFGASSLYLVLKVGMTVSASIPVAVLSITLFRILAKVFRLRPATILENNIVQTTGSAGESIAFGLGVTIPALLLLGHDMTIVRVMTVGALGGLLGILMMIPLRRAFIVQQHGRLRYPEGTACADVLIVGEEGGASARTVFAGFGLAIVHKFLMDALHLWKRDVNVPLYTKSGAGLKGGILGGELAPELLGVGYIIGPRIASIMIAGGVLAYLVIAPMIVMFGGLVTEPVPPATDQLISMMDVGAIRDNYILYIGAGAVATGGIISMFQVMPMIFHSLRGAMGDLSAARGDQKSRKKLPRTERDLPLWIVFVGCTGLILAMAALPQLGLGFTTEGLLGAALIVLFGFLFVTVSSRLTGEIGSSSNPISGMTVATLLLTCLAFVAMGHMGKAATLTALTIAAVVCIAASNGGTTSQDLKTGYLVGSTPWLQQVAILIGALTSALVIGLTLQLLNASGTVYTKKPEYVPNVRIADVQRLTEKEKPGGEYAGKDDKSYYVLHVANDEYAGVKAGKYLVDETGLFVYLVDPAINGRVRRARRRHRGDQQAGSSQDALMALIIEGILNGKLPWELVLFGALIAIVLELAGVPSLPFAVGVYLPLQTSMPIFLGGGIRWIADKLSSNPDDSDSSPAVLLSSGYIAGGSIAGVLIGFLAFKQSWLDKLNLSSKLPAGWVASDWPAVATFALLMFVLFLTGAGVLFRARSSACAAPAASNGIPMNGHFRFETQTTRIDSAMYARRQTLSRIVIMLATSAAASFADWAHADEGMWLFNQPPRALLKERYGFDPTDEWLTHLQKSAVRFNNGGSGSFVSAEGLVMTNHHVGADCLHKLSTAEKDLVTSGFHAHTRDEEIQCVDLELNVLMSIEDVTERVNAAVKPGMSTGEAQQARRAVSNTIEKESFDKTGLRSDVVTLFQGGRYNLYRYKKYTDVRLVFAPEKDIAFFGGDPDNFEYPRYDLDVCFFRIYEDGKPATPPDHLSWSKAGAEDEELIFVAGHPGRTDRLNTVDHLDFLRDVVFPELLDIIRRREVNLQVYSSRGLENARRARDELFGYQNARKARLGGLAGLQTPAIMEAKQRAEKNLREAVDNDPKLAETRGAWDDVRTALEQWDDIYVDYTLYERSMAFNTELYTIARGLVRLAEETSKPNEKRLREYAEAGLDSLKQQLFSEAPIYPDLEIVKLTDSLSYLLERAGTNGELVQDVMDNMSPSAGPRSSSRARNSPTWPFAKSWPPAAVAPSRAPTTR